MAHQIHVDGLSRTFQFQQPIAWVSYVRQLQRGLPVVIALHDSPPDPDVDAFVADWPFAESVARSPTADLEDRFFVFTPYAPFNRRVSTGGPSYEDRVWNYGWDTRGTAQQDDVAFIDAMLDHVEGILQANLDAEGLGHLRPFDSLRLFLFGVGLGGSMAFRLAAESSRDFAALFVINGAYGGQAGDGTMAHVPPVVRHDPHPGVVFDTSKRMSLLHLWGGMDTTVDQRGPLLSVSQTDLDAIAGQDDDPFIPDQYARRDAPAADSVAAYVGQLGGSPTIFSSWNGAPDQAGTNTSILTVYQADATTEVMGYNDPTLGHEKPHYFSAAGVWTWLSHHPRTLVIAP